MGAFKFVQRKTPPLKELRLDRSSAVPDRSQFVALDSMSSAISAGNILPVFQPIHDLETGEIVACEVLARWQHDELGLLPPDLFIPVAEKRGLLDELTMSLLAPVSNILSRTRRNISFAINISPSQLRDSWFVPKLLSRLIRLGIPPHQLTVEITESVLIEDFAAVRAAIKSFKSQGIRVALDDFGTGYSNLSYICELDFDCIKIDRSFVRNLSTGANAEKVVHAMVGLAAGLNLAIVAEGIETETQLSYLKSLGCHAGQGFLFAKPMSGERFIFQNSIVGMHDRAPVWRPEIGISPFEVLQKTQYG